ncbi:MAG: DUF1588 domain-containing protein, partial [Rhodospirillaceae bacterium]
RQFEYPAGDVRAGLLSQISFTAANAHPGRNSATLRGKAVRELFWCQPVPPPPANVNFSVVQETNNPLYKTARERLKAHANEAMCSGCHKLTDPIGLALENFDGVGQFRETENGAPLDLNTTIDGKPTEGLAGLNQVVHDNPATTSCLVQNLYKYAVGRGISSADKEAVDQLKTVFGAEGYRVPDLLRQIALSDAFVAVPSAEIQPQMNKEAKK